MTYDPGADAAERFPDWVIRRRRLGWGIHEVLSRKHRVILLEEGTTAAERRCSLAHAIAHLDLGHPAGSRDLYDRRQESEADQLAARRLIPLEQLLAVARWTRDPVEAAEELEVDLQTLTTRVQHLHPSERLRLRMTRQRLEESA